jgi:hypothetical protein
MWRVSDPKVLWGNTQFPSLFSTWLSFVAAIVQQDEDVLLKVI